MKQTQTSDARNKGATHERIIQAATDAFAERGYHDTSMDDIVRRAGISKGAIYFHFPGKEALFFALVGRLADMLEDSARKSIASERGAVARVDATLKMLLDMLSRHRGLAKVVLLGGAGLGPSLDRRLLALHERFARLIKGYLDTAVADGSITPVDTEVAAYVWLGAINEIVVRWLYAGQPDPLEKAVPHLRALLLSSVGVNVSDLATTDERRKLESEV
ncbi:MAG: TetR/AcrR family transcriptional regulator [Chloroflexi bacterium]|nr:TetR/AcrR family transcriptional regulator [Chloroflexota bacterium]